MVTPSAVRARYKKKPVPPKQLQAIVESHGQWLEHREKPNINEQICVEADLRHAKLVGANLERANLEGAVLREAHLHQSILTQARLAEPTSPRPSWKTAIWSEPISGVHDCRTPVCPV